MENTHVHGEDVVEKSVRAIKRNEPERKRKICNITEAKGYIRYKEPTTGYKVERMFPGEGRKKNI